MKSSFILLPLAIIVFGCQNPNVSSSIKKLVAIEEIKFELDSLTPDYFHGMEIVEKNDSLYFTFLNDLTNSIYYYDFESKQFVNRLEFEVGEMGIHRGVMTYSHFGMDSIFLFGKGRTSYWSNFKGEILDKFELIDLSLRQSPYSSNVSPIIITEDAFYYNSIMWGNYFREFQPILKFDVRNRKVELFDHYPEVYFQEGDWGAFAFDYIYQVHDKSENQVYYSFPNSNTIFVRDLATEKILEMTDSYFGPRITPPFENNNYVFESEDWLLKMNSVSIFGPIFLDKGSNTLIRTFSYGVKSPLRDPLRKVNLIHYDINLNKIINVFELPNNKYILKNSFFANGEFYIRKKSNEEDYIVFERFKL
ncbi:hypothetical protein [Algoriphagus sp. oki45]|uniref:hypothetical protein n=1 Tax=Algoriphagus sp. oki45 TaxID=3067294 RepID=UPI0030C6DFF2